MNDKVKYLITVRFPSWQQGENTYPAFGGRYLVEIPLSRLTKDTEPKEHMTEEEWATLKDPMENVKEYFAEVFENKIGHKFNGDVIFIDQMDIVVLI